MRFLAIFILLTSCWAGETQAQAPVNNSATALSFTLVFGSNVTSGNLVTVLTESDGAQPCPEISTITDSLGTTYATTGVCLNDATNGVQGEIWSGIPSSSGADTLTITFKHNQSHRGVAHEFNSSTGFPASPFDAGVCSSGAAGALVTSTNFVTTGSDDVLVGGELDRGGTAHAQGTGWTLGSSAGGRYRSEYQLDATAGTYAATWATNSGGAWISCGAGFQANSSGTNPCTNSISTLGAGCSK